MCHLTCYCTKTFPHSALKRFHIVTDSYLAPLKKVFFKFKNILYLKN